MLAEKQQDKVKTKNSDKKIKSEVKVDVCLFNQWKIVKVDQFGPFEDTIASIRHIYQLK